MPETGSSAGRLTLIQTAFDRVYQPIEEIHEFERVILDSARWDVVQGLPRLPFFKVSARLVAGCARLLEPVLHRFGGPAPGRTYLSVGYLAPHYFAHKTFPHFLIPGSHRAVWLYDAWEKDLPAIARTLRAWRVRWAFVSSRQAADWLNTAGLPGFQAHWVPEAVSVDAHRRKPWRERGTAVLQFGRRWDAYHAAIEPFCTAAGHRYLYETEPGRIIYPTRQEFVEGLADARISLCVPSSLTHPGRSGAIETMTWRYLQSMASGCLILGRMPAEMRALFDYEPMVEIDMNRPTQQLAQILAEYERYIPLIERNFEHVRLNHQWANRLETIERVLAGDEHPVLTR